MSKLASFVGAFFVTTTVLAIMSGRPSNSLHAEADRPRVGPPPAIQVEPPAPPLPPPPEPPPPAPKKRVMAVRLLVVKHSRESAAEMDGKLATDAATRAAAAGLDIKVSGNVWYTTRASDGLKAIISEHMKKDAVEGDTFMVHTIGHGHQNGSLQNLGQRADVMKAIAEAAEENKQRTLWWQLSCYASAKLPGIDTLTPDQQELLSNLASSSAREMSEAYTQARIMGMVFNALAKKDDKIDPNADSKISGKELKDFLNGLDAKKRGAFLFTRKDEDSIFGGVEWEASGVMEFELFDGR